MFDPAIVKSLRTEHKQLFDDLYSLETELKRRFYDLDDAIEALPLAVLSGEPMLLVGPPGTAKSRLIRAFCAQLGLIDELHPEVAHPEYFEYLLTRFTEPGELFGYYDIPAAVQRGIIQRLDVGMMQKATVVYLDEIFYGSSAIVNSLLAFLNERVFHDHGKRVGVEMQCLFAACNTVPDNLELRAIFDRFLLRCPVKNVEATSAAVADLVSRGWQETYGQPSAGVAPFDKLLKQAKAFQAAVATLTRRQLLAPDPGSPFFKALANRVSLARRAGASEMSNRRLVKMAFVMLAHYLYRSAARASSAGDEGLGQEQLALVARYFCDTMDDDLREKMERVPPA